MLSGVHSKHQPDLTLQKRHTAKIVSIAAKLLIAFVLAITGDNSVSQHVSLCNIP